MRRFGEPGVPRLEDVPTPEPGAGDDFTPEQVQQAIDDAVAGRYKAVIGAVLPLEQAAHGHELVAGSQVIGKVILDPNGIARS